MKINKKTQEEIIYDYFHTNLKVYEIANKYNLCRQSIRHVILENNLELKNNNTSDDIVKNVINDYLNGITNTEISKKYNLHRSVIQQILKRNGIELKSLAETSRKHHINNENYFNDIDTEEKAYILGLLYSDGYINHNGFGITLQETDKELLEKLSIIIYGKIVLGYKKSRTYQSYTSKPQYRFDVISKIMKNDLITHGCMENKTFKIRLPVLKEELYKHFIRGYFDGDGCLCIPKKYNRNITMTITSNTYFCTEVANYIKKEISVNATSSIRYLDIGVVRLTGRNQVIKFMNWLYTDSTLYMKRKKIKFDNYIINIE